MCAWTDRVDREFAAGNVTRTERDALLALASFRGHGGELFPSQASVAARAQCSDRTVRRAIAMAVTLGLVVVLPRRKWVNGRFLRTSNRYVIGVPDRAVAPVQRPGSRISANQGFCSTGQNGRGQELVSKKTVLEELLRAGVAAPDLLAARRQAMHQRQIEATGRKAW